MACAFFNGDFYFILKSEKPKDSRCFHTITFENGSNSSSEFEQNIDQLSSSGKGKNDHMGMVTGKGELLMCGSGMHGQLGLGDNKKLTKPELVSRTMFDGEPVLMVACGKEHTVVLTQGGGVYTFGHGQFGQLGHGDENKQIEPRRVPTAAFRPNGSAEGPGERVVMVAAGGGHTVALSEAGHVFTWGWGCYGQLGHNDEEKQLAPRQVEAGRFGGEKVVFVAAGAGHTVAVTVGGRLYTWGYGKEGQLGHGDFDNRLVPTLVGAGAFGAPSGGRVVMAACGRENTLVVTQDGALWACGRANCLRLMFSDDDKPNVSTTFKNIEKFDGGYSEKFDGHSDQKKVVSVASSLFSNDKQSVLTMSGIFAWPEWQDFMPTYVNGIRSAPREAYIRTESESKRRKMEQERNDVYEGLRRLKGYWVPKSAHQSGFAKVTVCSSCLLKISNANLTRKT